MSYIIIPVYSFACDSRASCSRLFDAAPLGLQKDGESLLDAAHRLLRAEGWAVRKRSSKAFHLCPEHKDEPEAAEPAKKGTCPCCSRKDVTVNKDGRLRSHVIKGTTRHCGGSRHRPS